MGTHDIQGSGNEEQKRAFMKSLLNDIRALEHMLENNMFDCGKRRIGVEQEVFLIGKEGQPASIAQQVLAHVKDPHYTPELGKFNLEINLDPIEYGGDCLRQLERKLSGYITHLRRVMRRFEAEPVLVGILPTLQHSDIVPENMIPKARYKALDEVVRRMRGGSTRLQIKGVDELDIEMDSVMYEACNTSFQVHFQLSPDEFARFYNIAQLVAAPVLAVSSNSPILLGKRLWSETRIALFQSSIDVRRQSSHMREIPPRVSFGRSWLKESVLEIFQEDIARYKIFFADQIDEDPEQVLKDGGIPDLNALKLHNGTVYRWNRPCYGISDGKPHLRIENRLIPSGPTVIDEVANAAFWFGLIGGIEEQYGDISTLIDFENAKANFIAAAHSGMGAQFHWFDGKHIPAQELIKKELIPLAKSALLSRGINSSDVSKYLGVIEERVEKQQTGSQWMIQSLSALKEQGSKQEQMVTLTKATLKNQKTGKPVHTWPLATEGEVSDWKHSYLRVEQYMQTDICTVHAEDTIELVAQLMDWQGIRHILVEDEDNNLKGLVSYRSLLKYLTSVDTRENKKIDPVSLIMKAELKTVTPETSTLEVIELMRSEQIACLPVIKEGKLVGAVTEADFIDITRTLITGILKE